MIADELLRVVERDKEARRKTIQRREKTSELLCSLEHCECFFRVRLDFWWHSLFSSSAELAKECSGLLWREDGDETWKSVNLAACRYWVVDLWVPASHAVLALFKIKKLESLRPPSPYQEEVHRRFVQLVAARGDFEIAETLAVEIAGVRDELAELRFELCGYFQWLAVQLTKTPDSLVETTANLRDSHQKALLCWSRAKDQYPDTCHGDVVTKESYEYIREHGVDGLEDYELPSFSTFRTYLNAALRVIHGPKVTPRRARRDHGRSVVSPDSLDSAREST
jgi:hypothetical protein